MRRRDRTRTVIIIVALLVLWRMVANAGDDESSGESPQEVSTGESAAASAELAPGDQGVEVLELQQALSSAGYPVVVDGEFGPQTAAALRAFQAASGLTVNGVVDEPTAEALGI
jgi:peptidoglycan hydrolase-like protein with peptidoglycan-binding domain